MEYNRREAIALLAGLTGGATARAAPFTGIGSRIRGLSLSSYSMRDSMRWRWGKETDRPMTMPTFFEYAAGLELEAIEPTSYFFPVPASPAFIAELRRHAHLLGLDISSAAMGNDFSWPPSTERGKANLAYAREWIDRFSDLGAPTIRVFASRRPPEDQTTDELIANVSANLSEIIPHAERRGVLLGVENHDAVEDPDLLLRIVKEADSPWLGVCWDSGNLIDTPEPYSHLEQIAPYAVVAQIKTVIPIMGRPTKPDFQRIVALLRSARYAGYLVLEYEEQPDPIAAIPGYVAALREAIR